jgi:protease I
MEKTYYLSNGGFLMAEKNLAGLHVAILASDGVEQAELSEPRKALDEAGAKTTLISVKSGKIQAMKHDDKSEKFEVDATLDKANPSDFDAVLLPGGALNADTLRVEKAAQAFVTTMDEAGKPIAVICHAPWLLVSAGLVDGRKLTSYHTIQDDIRNAGGDWSDSEVVRDNNWVSSRQPSDIPAFNREMIKLFGERSGKAAESHPEKPNRAA